MSISVSFGQNTKAIALVLGQNWLIFITFQSPIKINQFQFRSFLCQNTKAIALLVGQNWLIFITLQSPIKINQFQFRSFLAKIPRLQPYFLAKIGSFSSLFNLQSKINQFQFRSFLAKIPRLQPYLLAKIGSFSSLFNLQSKSINFNFGHFWPKYQGYSLTFWPKLAHFHHFSISNQNQSMSISVIFGQNTKALVLGQNWLHFHHFSISNQNQSISISVIFGQNSKAIALLLGQNWLIFITFQSPIKINQFQFRSFLAKIPRLQPYFLAKIGSFSSLFNLQSKSINFNFGHFWPKYQGYSLTLWPKIGSFSSLFNLQSKSINFNFGQCSISVMFRPKYQGYSLTLQPQLAHFHHFSISNQNQSISISVIFGQNTKAIALLFGQNWLIFITCQSSIKINHFQFRSFLAKIPRLQPYFLAKIGSFSSLFNLQSTSINFNFGHVWPKYQGYSLTSWPKLAHFHHFSISNQNQLAKIGSFSSLFNLQSNQSSSISVIFGQNTKAIALLFGQNWLMFITFQSPIKINQFQFRSCLAKIPRLQPYFLAKIGSFSSLFNLQSKSINFNFGHFWPKFQGYSLTFWPKLAHFHHFSISNQINQFQFRSFLAKIPRLQPYFVATLSIFNQNKSLSISVIFGQDTKAIALLLGQNWLIFITFQSPIKINQFQFRSILAKIPRLQPYFLAKIGSVSSLFNLQSKSIKFNFGHFWPNYQGYSLTFWPKLAHFHHFSISNQNQSISISVSFGQNTKAIALLFGQNWLIFITFQSPIKINQFQFRSFLAKIPRLQPQFLAKIGSFSSLSNLQSKSINFNFGHVWPKYQGYSLTSWPKLAHFHHSSISNQNQSISISVIFGQNTKAIALLLGQNWLIFITFQSPIKTNQFQFRSFVAKIPRLQPYFLAKIGSFSSLFNLQSK